MQIAVTLDIDMVHYEAGRGFDEMEVTFDGLRRCLEGFPDIKTTWFMRIDAQMEKIYGRANYIFEKHAAKIDWLRDKGHEIGWHHHAYAYDGKGWRQETDQAVVSEHLKRYGEIALKSGLKIARMGWGFHTNSTMKAVDDMGFYIDASAMPRPKYRWHAQVCDWSTSPRYPYHPSVRDYRIAGDPHLAIWEVPFTTIPVPMSTDTEPGVIRHIELAWDRDLFKRAIATVSDLEMVVLACHPYKSVASEGARALTFCDVGNISGNLETLIKYGKRFSIISEMVRHSAAY